MLLAVLLTGLICTLTWNNVLLQAAPAEPGYLDFDNLPETNFSCESKVIGGYYADVETGCQMFHVCTIGQKGEVADIKFLCLNGTVFDQETRVCERLDEVDCSKSESYYDLNLELYGNNGATYGIQPENEEEPPASNDKCEEEEDCKTEPQDTLPNNKPGDTEEEYEDLEDLVDPTTSSTSTTTTPRPSTSPRPAQIPYPTSSPETIAALLALHNAFQESLKEHERPGLPPRVPGSFPSPIPVPVKLPPLPPPRFSSPVSFSTSPRPLSFALNSQQNYVGRNQQPALPQQSQVSNHHFPSPQTHKQPPPQPQPFPFNASPRPKPLPGFTSTVRTSQAFGNSNFQQSFREEQQQQQQQQKQLQQQQQKQLQEQQQKQLQEQHNLRPEDDDDIEEYSAEDYDQSQASSPRPLYDAYKHNQNRFAISHQDTNPPSAPSSNFLLQQLKLRFNDNNPPQKHPGAHGFTRAVSTHDTKVPSFPEKPPTNLASLTTPAAVSVVLSKSSTTSVVRSVSSRNQSAIGNSLPPSAFNSGKYFPTSTLKPSSTTVANTSQPLVEDYRPEEEYEDYLDEDVEPDPFYKDVPKLERHRRNTDNNHTDTTQDLERIKKKYNMLLNKLQKKKYKDSKHEEGLRHKLLKLELLIKTAEATDESNNNNSPVSIESTDLIETTTEDETIYTFPTLTPPTPPVVPHKIPSPTPNTNVYKLYEFTLLSNQSFVLPPWSSTETSTTNSAISTLTKNVHQQNTSVPVPSPTPVTKTIQTDKNDSTVQHFFDLVDISEDLPIPVTALKRKLVQEDYFGSISSKTESIRDLLRRLKNRMGTKKLVTSQTSSAMSSEQTDLWFTTNVTDYLLANFSRSSCTNNDLYNEFLPSNETLALTTPSSPTKQLVGTRYIKLCQKCPDRGSNSRTLLFLIETRFLLDVDQYRQESTKGLKFQDLINMIELKSRIKVLQFKRKTKTFKVLREFSTKSNPRQLINKLVRKLGVSNPRLERD